MRVGPVVIAPVAAGSSATLDARDADARARPAASAADVAATTRLLLMAHGPLPLPGRGATLARWRILAQVGGSDMSVAKAFESHADALAILADLAPPGFDSPPDALWAVWAAEAPDAVLRIAADAADARPVGARGAAAVAVRADARAGAVTLAGNKAWCSVASGVSHGLVTARRADGTRQLCAVAMDAPGVSVDADGWAAVGMAATESATVSFETVRAVPIGAPDAYLSRAGFWHGGAGVAACWFGAARALGHALHAVAAGGGADAAHPPTASRRDERAVLRALALGQVDLALEQAAALLRALAARIDASPHEPHADDVRRARLAVDTAAREVLQSTMRALGPAPFVRDARLARLAADLPVFLRQCHGDVDLVASGDAVSRSDAPWGL